GRERAPVVPGNAPFQSPYDRRPVACYTAVGEARRLGGEDRDDGAVGVDVSEWLVEELWRLEIFWRHRGVRIQERRSGPVEHADLTAATSARRRRRRGPRLSVADTSRA